MHPTPLELLFCLWACLSGLVACVWSLLATDAETGVTSQPRERRDVTVLDGIYDWSKEDVA